MSDHESLVNFGPWVRVQSLESLISVVETLAGELHRREWPACEELALVARKLREYREAHRTERAVSDFWGPQNIARRAEGSSPEDYAADG